MNPNITLFDIENAPATGYYWPPKYDTNIIQEVERWKLLSYAAVDLNDEDEDVSFVRTAHRSDKTITQKLWRLLDETDIAIAHNAKRFDIRKVNAKFLEHDLGPPSPYQVIDTLKVSQKYFAHAAHNLDYIAQLMGFDGKFQHKGFELWVGCMRNEAEAWAQMEEYNTQDVRLLKRVYLKLRPWIDNHPNLGLWMEPGTRVCPNCGSDRVIKRGPQTRKTRVSEFQLWSCNNCGAWPKSRFREPQTRETGVQLV